MVAMVAQVAQVAMVAMVATVTPTSGPLTKSLDQERPRPKKKRTTKKNKAIERDVSSRS